MQEMHFKTTESGATAHICTDKNRCGDGRESQTGENTEPESGRKGRLEAKKENLYIYIWIIVVIFAYK